MEKNQHEQKHKKKKCPECPPAEKWAIPYADFLSLLLALFIALYAITSINKEKEAALKKEFIKIFDFPSLESTEKPVSEPSSAETKEEEGDSIPRSVSEANEKLKEALEAMDKLEDSQKNQPPLEQQDNGVLLKLSAEVMFEKGEAEIKNEDVFLFLKRVANVISKLPSSVEVSIRGHTDNSPVEVNSRFKDNLELSTARANSIVRELIKQGVSTDKISSAGFGEFRPLFSNDTEEGRTKNRRVEFFVTYNKNISSAVKKESILDKLGNIKQN
jgi:chemotaxis protein MotB